MNRLIFNPSNAALFCPSVYTGKEYPREFTCLFNLWIQFHEINDASTISTFGLLLRDNAGICFHTINKEQISSFAQPANLFVKRFTLHKEAWKKTASLWQAIQAPNW